MIQCIPLRGKASGAGTQAQYFSRSKQLELGVRKMTKLTTCNMVA